MMYALSFALGGLIGFNIHIIFSSKRRSGNLLVTEDEDGTYLSLQIGSIEDIVSRNEVIFKVTRR